MSAVTLMWALCAIAHAFVCGPLTHMAGTFPSCFTDVSFVFSSKNIKISKVNENCYGAKFQQEFFEVAFGKLPRQTFPIDKLGISGWHNIVILHDTGGVACNTSNLPSMSDTTPAFPNAVPVPKFFKPKVHAMPPRPFDLSAALEEGSHLGPPSFS